MTEKFSHLDQLADDLVEEHAELLQCLIKQRHSHNLTQADVAERMGVSQPTVAAFEHYDANPTLATIRRYALAVGAAITHSVSDSCCETDESFEAIVRSAGAFWSKPRSQTFVWKPSSTIGYRASIESEVSIHG